MFHRHRYISDFRNVQTLYEAKRNSLEKGSKIRTAATIETVDNFVRYRARLGFYVAPWNDGRKERCERSIFFEHT